MLLGDRMKRYELQSQHYLTPKTPVVVRVDGRSFHNLTKRMDASKPYDVALLNAMNIAAASTMEEIPSCRMYYQQSDEVSFLLSDLGNEKADPWFDYNISKLTSVVASIFTACFNCVMEDRWSELGTFDARAFNVPIDDLPNYFLWRMKDAQRNALSATVHTYYDHKEAEGANADAQRKMLESANINYSDYPASFRNGVFFSRYRGPIAINDVTYAFVQREIEEDINGRKHSSI